MWTGASLPYPSEYFSKILKKLKEVGGASRQRDFYL